MTMKHGLTAGDSSKNNNTHKQQVCVKVAVCAHSSDASRRLHNTSAAWSV